MRLFILLCVLNCPGFIFAEEGFVDLFNGKDLTGWHNVNGAPDTWSVKDKTIHCTGKPICALRTHEQYENFVMEIEWRHLRPGGNAGIFIWASPLAAQGQPFLRAIEVQVLDHAYGKSDWFTTHGDVFPIHGSSMKPFGRHNGMRSFPSEERSKGSPEWNHYKIECNGGTLRLHVNGKEVSGGEKCNWRKGYIGLESEGSPIEFRNIRLKRLPSTNATHHQSAPKDTEFETLYTGTGLEGWKMEGNWKASDWQLRCIGGGTAWSGKKFGDGDLIFDSKLAKGQEIVVIVREENGANVQLKGSGKWQRTRLRVAGGEVFFVDEDGKRRASFQLNDRDTLTGLIGLRAESDAAFANIYFKPSR